MTAAPISNTDQFAPGITFVGRTWNEAALEITTAASDADIHRALERLSQVYVGVEQYEDKNCSPSYTVHFMPSTRLAVHDTDHLSARNPEAVEAGQALIARVAAVSRGVKWVNSTTYSKPQIYSGLGHLYRLVSDKNYRTILTIVAIAKGNTPFGDVLGAINSKLARRYKLRLIKKIRKCPKAERPGYALAPGARVTVGIHEYKRHYCL
ncbi:MAG: hypothetical protein EB059_08325 [Alphaproteobacteria bacterium]|nr:hypothetical protein [Alphaproteobacteria bacterium]